MTEMRPAPDQTRAFRDALGRFATGVTLVTAEGPAGPQGFVANSFSALSLDPPLVLWSVARSAQRFAVFTGAAHFAIHVLGQHDADLVPRFARGGHGWEGTAPARNAEGVPVFGRALARFDCARDALHDGGDHVIVVGRVLRFTAREGAPLVFSQGHYGGFAPRAHG